MYIHSYTGLRHFTWDARKSSENFATRGFDYAFAARVFEGLTLEREDTRRDYGEPRIIAIGIVEGIALTVVYTDRAATAGHVVRRIIAARVASRRERRTYEEAIQTP